MSSSATTGGEGNITVTVTVSNTGSMDGDEVRGGSERFFTAYYFFAIPLGNTSLCEMG